MIKTTEEFKLPDDHIAESLHIALGCRPDEILFIDIETTGLSPKTADLYLIGVSYRQGNTWHIVQFMSESIDHEKEILINFQTLLKDFKYVVHFNGNRFDIPFLQEKFSKYGLNDAFENVESFDLYKKISPYKLQLGLPDCKQKTIELYLGIDREDKYDGGKLIPVYKEFVEDKDPENGELMKKGVIVRHLILPERTRKSMRAIEFLHERYGEKIYISLMNQYTPFGDVARAKGLERPLTKREYEKVVNYAIDLGITKAYIQEGTTASESFIPTFS